MITVVLVAGVVDVAYFAPWDRGEDPPPPRGLRAGDRRRLGPGNVLGPDICPDTGLALLSYDQAGALPDAHTAHQGPDTGWGLPEFRHSALSHLGEFGASLLLLLARSRRKRPKNVCRFFKPSDQAIAEVTSLLAPGDARR